MPETRKVAGRFAPLIRIVLVLVLCAPPARAGTADEAWLPLRNHNPFLQIFGLPAFEAAAFGGQGEASFRIDFDVANHADTGTSPAESVTLDGESYFLTLAYRRKVSGRLVLGIDLPFVGHSGGFLDGPIEDWHSIWGLSNTQRGGPRDELEFRYDQPRVAAYELSAAGFGPGDIRLNAAMPLLRAEGSGDGEIGVRLGLKLPTGDAGELRGSGAFDFSLGFYATDPTAFGSQAFGLSAIAGALFPGRSDILPGIQKDTVAFGGLAAAWRASRRFTISTGLYAQSAYYRSELAEIGDKSVQFALGGFYLLPGNRLSLSFCLVEDLFDNATTDFALQFSIRGLLRGER